MSKGVTKEEKKARMAESSSEELHQIEDKGYKKIFGNKDMFLEFLETFVKEKWVSYINKTDMIKIDKEFVLQDYRKKEADVAYRLKLKHPLTGADEEVIFYILLELQSSVDTLMPYRLLMYMTEIWKGTLQNVEYKTAQKADFKLPSIVPIIMYNGENDWTAVSNFRELQNGEEIFGDYLVDFKYILVNVNSYSYTELIRIANAVSIIVMMDQKIVAKDKHEFQKRFEQLMELKEKLPLEKFETVLEWLQEVFRRRFPEDTQNEIKEIISSLKEGKAMTYAIERLFDNVEREAETKGEIRGEITGEHKGKLEVAKEMLKEGEPIEKIVRYSKLPMEEINKLKSEMGIK